MSARTLAQGGDGWGGVRGIGGGAGAAPRPLQGPHPARSQGRPVQVDPIKPTLKAPGTERLKL
jgi:hypothetical protein